MIAAAGPDWQAIALGALSLVELLALTWVQRISSQVDGLQHADANRKAAILGMQTGVEASGKAVEARLDTIHEDVQLLRADVQRALQELAEHRGARRREP